MATGRWGDYAPSGGADFVNKEDWAEREVPFYITKVGVRDAHGKFKAEWQLTVVADGEDQTIVTFSQGAGSRDDAIEAAGNALASGEVTEIGPVIIKKVRTKTGNPFFALEEAEEDGDDVSFDNTTKPRTQLDNQMDDLPF